MSSVDFTNVNIIGGFMTTTGQRVKKIRLALNMSQEQFGHLFNSGKSYISAVEKDKSRLSVDSLVKLLLNYNVNLNYLLGGIGEPFLETPQQDEQLKKLVAQIVEKEMKKYGVIDKCI